MAGPIAGFVEFRINGELYRAKGSFTYNLGNFKREGMVDGLGLVGYKETPQVAFIEGAIYDSGDLDIKSLQNLKNETITLTLVNGKVIALREAFYAADGNVTTDEGEVEVRFEGTAEEIR